MTVRKPLLALLFPLIACSVLSLEAQNTSYQFGDVEVGTKDSLYVHLGQTPEGEIALLSFFDAFQPAAAHHHTSEDSFKVYFSPTQNIRYNGELIVRFRGMDGTRVLKVFDLKGNGRLNDPYYSSTFDLKDEALKNELGDLIDGHNSLGYSAARDEMFMDFDNWKNNGRGANVNTLEGVYTGKLAEGYNNRQDAQSNYNFNTEHTFPQGTFDKNEPMRSDLHHLFPTKMYANSERGNKPFGMVSNPSWTEGGSRSSHSTFEPRDEQKGRTARGMLYFLLRYQNYQNYVSNSDQQVLIDWADTYPPDEVERNRNEAIYQLQNNRNPLVDHALFLERIHNFIGNSTTPTNRSYALAADTLQIFSPMMSSLVYFDFAFVNNGNTSLEVEKVNTYSQDLTVDSVTSNVAAGDAGLLKLNWHISSTDGSSGPVDIIFNQGDTATFIFEGNIVTGISKVERDVLAIHPNPARDRIRIKRPVDEAAIVRIYDASGRLFQTTDLVPSKNYIDITSLPQGFYMLELKTSTHHFTGRFMKQ